jgi:uncharacterized membrane protein
MVKLYAKDSYKKAKYAPKVRGVIDLFRPFTLLAPLIGGIAAALMALAVDPLPKYANRFIVEGAFVGPVFSWSYPFMRWEFPLLEIIIGVSALMLVNAGSNVLNQVYDFRIDKINKPYRPIPSKVITLNEARTVAWVVYLITLWRTTAVGSGAFLFLILIIMLITIFIPCHRCILRNGYSSQTYPSPLPVVCWVSRLAGVYSATRSTRHRG